MYMLMYIHGGFSSFVSNIHVSKHLVDWDIMLNNTERWTVIMTAGVYLKDRRRSHHTTIHVDFQWGRRSSP